MSYLKSTKCNPLRPMVSSRGSVTYGVEKVLSKVLKPLIGKSYYHVQRSVGKG